MSQAATDQPVESRPGTGAYVWFVGMVGLWTAFGALAVLWPQTLTDLWDWVVGLPLAAEIVLWIATLPWMLALAVLQSSWEVWVQGVLVACFALCWTLASIPRSGERGTLRSEIRPGHRHDVTVTRGGLRHTH